MSGAPALVIFDCDGVLVDSEPLSLRVLVECLEEAGLALDHAAAQERFLGKSMATMCDMLREEDGVDFGPDRLDDMRARLYALFERELQPVPGVAEALDAIGAPRCVASSSQPERIRLSLRLTGLLDRLEPHIFSATMVAAGKPAPDLFLHAARQMGAAPEASVVIEDSPAGIEAAQRAGMRVLAFTGGGHAREEAHLARLAARRPDHIFDDMAELPAILRAQGMR